MVTGRMITSFGPLRNYEHSDMCLPVSVSLFDAIDLTDPFTLTISPSQTHLPIGPAQRLQVQQQKAWTHQKQTSTTLLIPRKWKGVHRKTAMLIQRLILWLSGNKVYVRAVRKTGKRKTKTMIDRGSKT